MPALAGLHSLKLRPDPGRFGAADPWDGAYQIVTVAANQRYRVRLQVRANQTANNAFQLVLDNGSDGAASFSPVVWPGTPWQMVEATYTTDSTGRLGIQVLTKGTRADEPAVLYVDDVYILYCQSDANATPVDSERSQLPRLHGDGEPDGLDRRPPGQ